jgi:hypothetical protein
VIYFTELSVSILYGAGKCLEGSDIDVNKALFQYFLEHVVSVAVGQLWRVSSCFAKICFQNFYSI